MTTLSRFVNVSLSWHSERLRNSYLDVWSESRRVWNRRREVTMRQINPESEEDVNKGGRFDRIWRKSTICEIVKCLWTDGSWTQWTQTQNPALSCFLLQQEPLTQGRSSYSRNPQGEEKLTSSVLSFLSFVTGSTKVITVPKDKACKELPDSLEPAPPCKWLFSWY